MKVVRGLERTVHRHTRSVARTSEGTGQDVEAIQGKSSQVSQL